jgi:hypothetical protein
MCYILQAVVWVVPNYPASPTKLAIVQDVRNNFHHLAIFGDFSHVSAQAYSRLCRYLALKWRLSFTNLGGSFVQNEQVFCFVQRQESASSSYPEL